MSNLWSQFERLTSKRIVKVGTVTAHEGTMSVVQDRSENTFRVDGTDYDVGTLVYIENGTILSEAPVLTDVGIHYV